jgi:hypothetical protein
MLQGFEPLDFLAEVTQPIPDPGEHLIRYYGWYSNKTRGQRAQRRPAATAGTGAPARPPTARQARQGWAAPIKQVYEADPLCGPRCGAELKIIALIACLPKPRRRAERHQTEVIRRRSSSYGGTGREDSPLLWALGGGCCPGPALGEGLGYRLRLRARGTGGAVAPRVRRGLRSAARCALDGRCDPRLRPLWPPDRPSWRPRPPFGAGGRPPTSPERPTRHLAGDNSAPLRH